LGKSHLVLGVGWGSAQQERQRRHGKRGQRKVRKARHPVLPFRLRTAVPRFGLQSRFDAKTKKGPMNTSVPNSSWELFVL
jgi:hypothetical protein